MLPNKEGLYVPLLQFLVGNEKDGSRIYKRLISRNWDVLSKCVNACQSFKKITKDCDCSYVRYLQFRLLHRNSLTHELLYQMKIVHSP